MLWGGTKGVSGQQNPPCLRAREAIICFCENILLLFIICVCGSVCIKHFCLIVTALLLPHTIQLIYHFLFIICITVVGLNDGIIFSRLSNLISK